MIDLRELPALALAVVLSACDWNGTIAIEEYRGSDSTTGSDTDTLPAETDDTNTTANGSDCDPPPETDDHHWQFPPDSDWQEGLVLLLTRVRITPDCDGMPRELCGAVSPSPYYENSIFAPGACYPDPRLGPGEAFEMTIPFYPQGDLRDPVHVNAVLFTEGGGSPGTPPFPGRDCVGSVSFDADESSGSGIIRTGDIFLELVPD